MDNIIIASTLYDKNPVTQANNIVRAFNQRVDPYQTTFETSLFLGHWVNPNQFILGATNQIPELQLYNGAQKLKRCWYLDPTINTEMIAIREQTELFFGAYGSYILNVPVNKYAKAWSGIQPLLFGTGPRDSRSPILNLIV